MELNEVTKRLPKHLLQFVVDQPYDAYTPIDQAVWRYVMRRNCRHLRHIAHESYLQGLKIAGVEIDRIPTMYGMNRILREIGWAAVAVDGFIPPGAFMEFTQYNVLVIAADIRTIEHIEYTPAPDIIHESAGHAPILAVPEFAAYLRAIGEAGAKAFSSKKDVELYEAIRHLSIIKEDPNTTTEEIREAEHAIDYIQHHMGPPSEMALIRNLHWWTVEYGLIGTLDNFKLYGAGLLSSIGEGMSCLKDDVKKLPYTLEAMNVNYDITKPQPQLFVTPDFDHLTTVLGEFKKLMAWTTGGLDGINKAIASQQTGTIVYSSGLQVSGTFADVVTAGNAPAFVRTTGPSALSIGNRELKGYDKSRFPSGFSSPIGDLAGSHHPFEDLSDEALGAMGIRRGARAHLLFNSGVTVNGLVREIVRTEAGKIVLIDFDDIRILHNDTVLCEANTYTMAVGSKIISGFAGPADVEAFEPTANVPREKMHKIKYDAKTRQLQALYGEVRSMREGSANIRRLGEIHETLEANYSKDWLLSLEILELLQRDGYDPDLQHTIKRYLERKTVDDPALTQLIRNGLALLGDDQRTLREV